MISRVVHRQGPRRSSGHSSARPYSPEGVVAVGCGALSPQLRYDEGLHEVPDELGVGTHVFGSYPHIAAQWFSLLGTDVETTIPGLQQDGTIIVYRSDQAS